MMIANNGEQEVEKIIKEVLKSKKAGAKETK
jgi:hypothetical protein